MHSEDGIIIEGKYIFDLRCADNTALLAKAERELQEMDVKRVATASRMDGLYVNDKTAQMMTVRRNKTIANIKLNNGRLEQVDTSKYLVSNIAEDGSCRKDIRQRIVTA